MKCQRCALTTLQHLEWANGMAGALDTYPRRDLAEYVLSILVYFQLYIYDKYSMN